MVLASETRDSQGWEERNEREMDSGDNFCVMAVFFLIYIDEGNMSSLMQLRTLPELPRNK